MLCARVYWGHVPDYTLQQATQWSLPTLTSFGFCAVHSLQQPWHRVWKQQPFGGLMGLGTSPSSMSCIAGMSGSGIGIAPSSAFVYGCSGLSNSYFFGAISTMLPRYITAMRSQMCLTTLRLCEMKMYVS